MASETTSLEHRRFLRPNPRPFRGSGLFEKIGGHHAVARLVATLYDGLAGDPGLRPVFDRRAGSGGTALHHAARAGFLRTITVLLGHGADPYARDDDGATPTDWLERATGSVDRRAVRALLDAGR